MDWKVRELLLKAKNTAGSEIASGRLELVPGLSCERDLEKKSVRWEKNSQEKKQTTKKK